MEKIKLAINGACGRMGRRLVALAGETPGLELVAAVEHPGHALLGEDAGVVAGVGALGLAVVAEVPSNAQALIDFSTPAGAQAAIRVAKERSLPLVMATTGLPDAEKEAIRELAKKVPVVWSPSMSAAVNLTMKLVEIAGKHLKDHPGGADVEILERHHRFKEDSPSGTALKFGEIVGQAMGIDKQVHGREGFVGKRPHGEIGFHAIRTGDNPGEHTILFGMLGETIELTVRASNRDCYAIGALQAAKFVAGKPPGLYSMNDVLGL
ncbi:MAG TPA: 4-hydroxy-tetrahydrodipicolinate reductase [Pirellulaceae bacterium]|jgi:4-hydroxy-tetrahydrodipicolinate reductase|nr:4-hydroxy-tetrahydrodipicolinate reductase [Pirellulaceae bacterium]